MAELAQVDLLHTIAEVAAAFVGFSLVAGLLGAGAADRYRFFSIRDVAEVGLSCLAGALLPSAFHAFDLQAEATWRLASATFSLLWIFAAFIGIRRFWRSGAPERAPRFPWFGPFSAVAGNLLLWWNLLSTDAAPGRFVLSLLLLLAFAGLSFIAAVFEGREEAGD